MMLKRRWNPDGKANNTNTDRLDWVIDTCHKTLFYSTQQHTTGWIQHQHVPNSTYVKRTVSNFLWWRICVIHSHRSQVANNNVRFWNGSVQGAKKFSSSAASMLRPAAEQLGCSTGSRTPSSWAHSGGTWMHVRMRPGPALISWCPLLLQICKYDLWVFFLTISVSEKHSGQGILSLGFLLLCIDYKNFVT
jgi:hypothetical protein